MLAVQLKLTRIVDLLVKSNARLNDVLDVDPGTILAAAIESGDEVMIKNLLNAGAELIGLRIRKIGNLQTAMLLHNDGILPKILNYCGPKLLAAAISARDERLVCFLRQNNADKDLSETASLENTPFHAHIAEPMRPESDLNCAISDDPSFSSSFGHGGFRESTTPYSPLQAAVRTQQVSIVRDLIVSRGADVNYLGDSIFGRTPLQYAVELGNMEIFNLLIEHGADVNAPAAGHRGATALQIAAIQGYIGIARKLLDLGSDVNQDPADKNGRTASMGAAENGRIDVLQLLLDEGAHVVGEYEGYYYEAVALAEGRGHYAAARLLKLFKDSAELGTS